MTWGLRRTTQGVHQDGAFIEKTLDLYDLLEIQIFNQKYNEITVLLKKGFIVLLFTKLENDSLKWCSS